MCLEVLKQDLTPQAALDAPSADVQSSSPLLSTYRLTSYPAVQSDADRFYLHHFITYTSIVYFPLQPETALSLVIPTTQHSPSRTAAMAATVASLSALRKTITVPIVTSQHSAILCTMLFLATSCVCAGDTRAFRKHLNGALNILHQEHGTSHAHDALWWLSLKWLVQLYLMNRLSGLPLTSPQEGNWSFNGFNWDQPLAGMLGFGHIDAITGLSRQLITTLEGICELSAPTQVAQNGPKHNTRVGNSHPNQHQVHIARQVCTRSLESRLLKIEHAATSSHHDSILQKELEFCHSMYIKATLLCLYRRVDELPKSHPKVQLAVESMIDTVQKLDMYSRTNIQLLWPLLTAGCEAMTDFQRSVVADRMTALSTHGHGNYSKVLQFMKEYWENGGGTRWDVFGQRIGLDLVLF
ncbi:hypothetical protein TrVGV298_008001 [Trichoderma virens]|nr:hypothetical protein TrVGV298_008001 [Trichoderma virens]